MNQTTYTYFSFTAHYNPCKTGDVERCFRIPYKQINSLNQRTVEVLTELLEDAEKSGHLSNLKIQNESETWGVGVYGSKDTYLNLQLFLSGCILGLDS
jgi:hypothetical protein